MTAPRLLRRSPRRVVWVGVAAAIAVATYLAHDNHEAANTRFRAVSARAVDRFQQRLMTYEYGLRSARGAVIGAGGATITHDRFHAYVASRDLAREFPGVLGFGFIRRVPAGGEAALVAQAQADGERDFAIRSLGPTQGDHFVVAYFEPEASNRAALGLDLASEPRRHAAAIEALVSGQPILAAPSELLGPPRPDETPAVYMLMTVYRDGESVPRDRADADARALGWVVARIDPRAALGELDHDGDFVAQIADVTDPRAPVPLFESKLAPASGDAVPSSRTIVTRYGRTFRVDLRATSSFLEHLGSRSPLAGGALTFAVALLLAGWLRSVRSSFLAGERRIRELAEAVPHLIWSCTPDGACDYVSPQWEAYTGRGRDHQLGDAWLSQLHPDDLEQFRARWAASVTTGAPFEMRCRIRSHDGGHRWFQTRGAAIRDGQGRIAKWYGSCTDIQELRDAQDATDAFAARLEARVAERSAALLAANATLDKLAGRLQNAQRIGCLGAWEFDLANERVVWSEELFRIAGLDPTGDAPPYPVQEAIFAPASWAALNSAVARARATGEAYQLTLELIRPDGQRRTAIARGEAVCDARGKVIRLAGTLQDVTELADAQAKIAVLGDRMRLATNAANVGIWDWNIVDNVLVWDDVMYRLYDISPGEFAGVYEGWRTRLFLDDLADAEAAINDALAGTREFATVFRVVNRAGEVRHIRGAAAVYRDPTTGAPLRMIGVNWDITEQRLAERALRSTEAVQRGILAHAGPAIIATDREGVITHFNPAAEEMVGLRAAALIGRETPAVFHDRDEVEARLPIVEADLGISLASPFDVFVARARRGEVDTQEWTYLHQDGRRVPVLLTMSALRDPGGELVGFLGVAVDLTAQKRQGQLLELNRQLAERSTQAESASEAKSMFLANMSHEIRTPINAITGVTYLLSKTQLSSDQKELVQTLRSGARTVLGMINDILDLSKIEARQLTLDHSPFQLSRVTDDISAMMAGLATDKRLELVVDVADSVPEYVVGDPIRLTQILTNLVGNAIKFTDRGTVRLGVSRRGAADAQAGDGRPWLRFEVQDTGPGIDPAVLPRLFTPFSQGDSSNVRRTSGTGLGLAIVKQLVELFGGRIGMTSTPGAGSEFWFEVPFARIDATDDRPWGRELQVLVVDDHALQRRALSGCVRRVGWKAVEAIDAAEAIGMFGDRRPSGVGFDVVILACGGDGTDGAATIDALRAAGGDQPPVIIITTNPERAAMVPRGQDHGASAVLTKPVSASVLFNAVTAALAAHGDQRHFSAEFPQVDALLRLAGARILVADDSTLNQIVAARVLELDGAAVVTVGDGLQALERIEREPGRFDAILMDVQMPNLDGIEATRRIRALAGCADLPIVAVTAGAMEADRQLALAAGVNEVISKPFDPEVVVWTVRKLIERSRGRAIPVGTRPPPTVEVAAGWAALDGFDVEDARLRLGGDRGLFVFLLGQLMPLLDDLARPTEPLTPAAATALADQLHKLRGSAGNLGARDLCRVAGDAEAALRDRDPTARFALQRVYAQIDRLQRSVPPLLAEGSSATIGFGAAGARPSTMPEREALDTFLRALELQDLEALALFPAVSASLLTTLGAADHDRVRVLLDRLDFATVATIVAGSRPG